MTALIRLYGGIGVAIIIVGVAIFFFAMRTKPQAKVPTAAPTPATSSAPFQPVPFPAGFGTPDITIGTQAASSGQQVVVQWNNLPSGTEEISVFRAATEGSTSVLVGKIKIPSSTILNGSSSLTIPSGTPEEYYYTTTTYENGSSTPPPGDQGSGSSTTDGNPPPQDGGSTSSTSTSSSTSNSDFYVFCAAGQCEPTSTPGATSCDTACSAIPASAILVATCSPNSIPVGQTSQCVLDLNGVPQNEVVWTLESGNNGSVSASGVYVPSAAGTEMIVGTLSDGTSANATVTVTSSSSASSSTTSTSTSSSSDQNGSPEGSMPIQSSLTWNGNNYSVENGLYTTQDMVYISNVTDGVISNITVYCSYSEYSAAPLSLGNGDYEISDLSSHGCNTPNSINYLDLGGYYGNGLDISINPPQ